MQRRPAPISAVLGDANVYRGTRFVKTQWCTVCDEWFDAERCLRAEPTVVNDSHALVLSSDALIAALLGALLEIHGYSPFFADSQESARDALRRVRPAIVLVDCEQDEACSEAFFGPATMTGARVIMFSASRSRQEVASFAARYGFDWFILPIDLPSFSKVVRATPR